MKIVGQSAHSTGDLKLVSALMSVGIPLDPKNPAAIIIKEDGTSYSSFRLLPISADGKESTGALMEWWAHPEKAKAGHPFKAIMAFISDAPQGCKRAAHWLDFAHQWLTERGQRPPDAPRRIEDIPDFVSRHQGDLARYVFAVAFNRETCWKEYLIAREAPDYLMQRGKAVTKVNHNTPKRIADELITRLKG